MRQRSHQQRDRSPVELWQVDCGRRCRLTHCHHHQCRLRELESSERESPGQISKPSEPLQNAWVATRSDLESGLKPRAVSGLRNVSVTRPKSFEPLNRMNPRCKFGVWLGVRNNSAECRVETAEGVFSEREGTARQVRQRSRQQLNGVPWS